MSFPIGPSGFAGIGGMLVMRRGIEFLGHETLLLAGQRFHVEVVPEVRADGRECAARNQARPQRAGRSSSRTHQRLGLP
jgi:hypothetical protein